MARTSALGWYYYPAAHLRFPFEATCIKRRATSPLKVGETVTITGLAPEDDCRGEIVALATLNGRPLGVPLSQLRALRVPDEAAEAIADWHYWSSMGYRF